MVQNERRDLEIILVLMKKESHLREISREIGDPHSTVLRKINELVKENILDHKQEGKNKKYFIKDNLKAKNLIYSAEIYRLNKLLKKHPELSIIFEEIINDFKNGMVILFGSYAKGNEKPESDIDIYLETTDNKIKNKIKEINSRLSVKIGEFGVNSLLIKEIIKNHVIIKGFEEYYERINFFKKT